MAAQVTPAVRVAESGHSLGLWARLRRGTPWWAQPLDRRGGARRLHRLLALDLLLRPRAQPLSEHANYLSPFFSPLLWKTGPVTPALWVLWAPLGFRATCYYYRKSYYRSFFWDPPACAIGELRHRGYRGETRLPMVLNNLHRFFWYPAAIVVVFLWVDAFASFDDNGHLYLGLGTLILLVNAVLLSGYSLGCHAFRHTAGGGLDCFSCSAGRQSPLPAVADGHLSSTAATPPGPGSACSAWSPPRSTSACSRPACPTPTSWSTEMTEPYVTRECDVLVVGAGGAGHARRHRRRRGRLLDAGGHQVPARQGPHGDGRGRHRRRAGQRQLPGQLGGPLRRHHAGRPAGQQLADGRRLQPRGHRPRLRAGAVGRPLRPHRRRADHAAGLRRPQLPAALPRRRPHRPRADPHLPGPAGAHGRRRRPDGVHPHPAAHRPATGSAAPLGTTATPASSSSSGPGRWCWPRAAGGGCTATPPTPGRAPATVPPWPTRRAPSCRTWSSSSSIPPG